MKTLLTTTTLLLAFTSTAMAKPIHLGFGDAPARTARPLVLVADVADQPAALPEAPVRAAPERTIFGLPKNVGPVDRVLRTALGAALVGAGIWGLTSDEHLSSTTSGILIGVSAIPFATAATGYCPVYQLFGIDRTF
jgi:hypothetical protein